MKKKLLVLSVLIFVVLSFTAGVAAQDVSIEFWTMQLSPTFNDYINGMIEEFEADNPGVEVNWVDVPWADMEMRLLSASAAGTAPDVVNLNVPFSMQIAELGGLVDMDEHLSEEVIDRYFETVWSSNTYDGRTHAIPWYLSTSITMYNSEILAEAGLDPNNIRTLNYNQLPEIGRRIKDETGKYLMLPPIGETGRYLEYMVREGIPLLNEARTEAAFNTPESVEFLEMWVEMFEEGLIPRETVTEGHNAAVDLYQSNQAAFLLTGPQFLDRIEENAPTVFENTMVAPEMTGAANKVGVAVMNIAVLTATDYLDESLDFATFITNDKNQLDFAKLTSILPSTKEAAADPFFTEVDQDSQRDMAKRISAEQLERAENLIPPLSNQNQLNEAINQMVQNALLGQKTAAEAIADAEAEWNQILAE